jgi:hypothetical protein
MILPVPVLYYLLKRRERQRRLRMLLLLKRRNQIRSRNYVSSDCLRHVSDSDWFHLYNCGTDANFVCLTSLTRAAFEQLLAIFKPHYPINTSVSGGRPSKFQHHHQVLGCLLIYYCDTIGVKNMCQIFAAPPSTINRVLLHGEIALQKALRAEPSARCKWPSSEEQVAWAAKVAAKEPLRCHLCPRCP